MDTYSKHIDEDEFVEQREQQLLVIAQNLCIDHPEEIDAHNIREVIDHEVSLVNEYWEDYSSESIGQVSDIGEFAADDVYLEGTAEAIIRNVAWLSLSSNIEHYIKLNKDKFHETRVIHNYLSAVINGRHTPEHFQVDDCTPSALLSDFSRYLARSHDGDPPEYDDFNETHIRGINVINVFDDPLRIAILEWLNSITDDDTAVEAIAETECEFKLEQLDTNTMQ